MISSMSTASSHRRLTLSSTIFFFRASAKCERDTIRSSCVCCFRSFAVFGVLSIGAVKFDFASRFDFGGGLAGGIETLVVGGGGDGDNSCCFSSARIKSNSYALALARMLTSSCWSTSLSRAITYRSCSRARIVLCAIRSSDRKRSQRIFLCLYFFSRECACMSALSSSFVRLWISRPASKKAFLYCWQASNKAVLDSSRSTSKFRVSSSREARLPERRN